MDVLYHPVTIGTVTVPGNLFLAPVAGYSDRPFRSLCTRWGASCCFSEMVSSEALVRGSGKTEQLLARAENERCFGVQLFGGNPESMAGAARMVRDSVRPEIIDINAGCPVPKIIKSGAGSALTRDPERLFAIVKAVVDAVPGVPVTVKIRSGWDDAHLSWKEAAHAALEAGCAMITLHPRTRVQGYEGSANWQLLAELCGIVRAAARPVPVFGSGDLFTPEDAARMIKETGVDGIMFARGAMGNPFIFTLTQRLLTEGSCGGDIPVKVKMTAALEELVMLTETAGETCACREMRKRFCAYSRGIHGGAELRAQLVQAATAADYIGILYSAGLIDDPAKETIEKALAQQQRGQSGEFLKESTGFF